MFDKTSLLDEWIINLLLCLQIPSNLSWMSASWFLCNCSQFQFALVTDGEPLNSITMSNVELPALLVYDAKSQYYYIPEQEIKDFTLKEYRQFLLDIAQDKIPVSIHVLLFCAIQLCKCLYKTYVLYVLRYFNWKVADPYLASSPKLKL